MNDRHRGLLAMLAQRSFVRDDACPFLLSSGQLSPVYIDCSATTMRADARAALGRLVQMLPPGIRAVGGPTMGADPIAYAMACYAYERAGYDVEVFSVRTEPKRHGEGKWIEGVVEPGVRVVVVDDVVTTGSSVIQAIRRCWDVGLVVASVLVLVDREANDGMAKIRDVAGPTVPVIAVFTASQIEQRWRLLTTQKHIAQRSLPFGSLTK